MWYDEVDIKLYDDAFVCISVFIFFFFFVTTDRNENMIKLCDNVYKEKGKTFWVSPFSKMFSLLVLDKCLQLDSWLS